MLATDTPFPVIDAPVVALKPIDAGPLVPTTISATVLAQFAATEAALTTLAAKYHGVAYDVGSTKGLADAKAARLDLRENGRFLVQRAEKRVKDDVNDLKKLMATEVERLVGIVRPTEDAIHLMIESEEERREAEKAERARIAAERVAKFNAQLDTIRGYAKAAANLPSEKIANGIAKLEALDIGPEWEEFEPQATETRQITLDVLRTMHTAAAEREAEEAERQRQREENARVKAELAEQRRQLAEQQAAIQRQAEVLALAEASRQVELAAQQAAEQAARDFERVQFVRAELAAAEAMAQQLCCIPPQPALIEPEVVAFTHRVEPVQLLQPIDRATEEPLFLELGDIETVFGFHLSGRFLTNALGIKPTAMDGVEPLFNPAQWPAICDALLAHITTVKESY